MGDNSVVTFFDLYCNDSTDQGSVSQTEGEAYDKRHMSFIGIQLHRKVEHVDNVFDLLPKDV